MLLWRQFTGQATTPAHGVWRALRSAYPLLTALRLTIWLLSLAVLWQLQPETGANPVALTALMTIWLGSVTASHLVNRWMCLWSAGG
ncbi:hypothetical protein ACFP81_05850 [Deinococcus lacus]|uniref:Uncharacterized protein n=1 Tax=Deinococcus lacus TaxID=392561 RepID=A0ABW1YBN6_9DEIO